MTDQGTEFFDKPFQTLLKNEDIQLFNTFNETKASIVERVIRTFKTKMWRLAQATVDEYLKSVYYDPKGRGS